MYECEFSIVNQRPKIGLVPGNGFKGATKPIPILQHQDTSDRDQPVTHGRQSQGVLCQSALLLDHHCLYVRKNGESSLKRFSCLLFTFFQCYKIQLPDKIFVYATITFQELKFYNNTLIFSTQLLFSILVHSFSISSVLDVCSNVLFPPEDCNFCTVGKPQKNKVFQAKQPEDNICFHKALDMLFAIS